MNDELPEGYTTLTTFLEERMRAKGWSARETARQAGISSGAISNLMREAVKPRAETLKALAKALEVEDAKLLYLAGHLGELPTGELDPSASHIAQRLTDLPPEVRRLAIDALGSQLDALVEMHRENIYLAKVLKESGIDYDQESKDEG